MDSKSPDKLNNEDDLLYVQRLNRWAIRQNTICDYVQLNNFKLGIDDPAKFIAGYLLDNIIHDDGQCWDIINRAEDMKTQSIRKISGKQIILEMEIARQCLIKRIQYKLQSPAFEMNGNKIRKLLEVFLDHISTPWREFETMRYYQMEWEVIVREVKRIIENSKRIKEAVEYVFPSNEKRSVESLITRIYRAMEQDGIDIINF